MVRASYNHVSLYWETRIFAGWTKNEHRLLVLYDVGINSSLTRKSDPSVHLWENIIYILGRKNDKNQKSRQGGTTWFFSIFLAKHFFFANFYNSNNFFKIFSRKFQKFSFWKKIENLKILLAKKNFWKKNFWKKIFEKKNLKKQFFWRKKIWKLFFSKNVFLGSISYRVFDHFL